MNKINILITCLPRRRIGRCVFSKCVKEFNNCKKINEIHVLNGDPKKRTFRKKNIYYYETYSSPNFHSIIGKFIKNFLLSFSIFKYTRDIIKNKDIDIIINFGHFFHLGIPILLISKLKKKPYIVMLSSYQKEFYFLNYKWTRYFKIFSDYMEKKILKNAFKITVLTNKHIGKIDFVNKNKIIVLPPSVDAEYFKLSSHKIRNKIIIGYIGRLDKLKGIQYLIKAFKKIKNKKSELHIIGEGPYKKELIKLVNAKDKIFFRGYIDHKKIKNIIKKIDILVLPSLTEGLGIVILEAFAMEKPVIASDVGGIPEIVNPYKTGILVKPRNINQLARAIDFLIDNPKLRKKMGKNARKLILENYTSEKIQKVYDDLLKNV